MQPLLLIANVRLVLFGLTFDIIFLRHDNVCKHTSACAHLQQLRCSQQAARRSKRPPRDEGDEVHEAQVYLEGLSEFREPHLDALQGAESTMFLLVVLERVARYFGRLAMRTTQRS